MMAADPGAPAPGPRRVAAVVRHRGVRVAVGVAVGAVLAVEALLVAPHLRGAGATLRHLDWRFVALAVAAEAVSFVAFAGMQRQMLRAGGVRVRLAPMTAIVLAANAFSATLPAGSALASGYGFWRWRRLGASASLAAWTVLVTGLISAAVLAMLGLTAGALVGTGRGGVASTVIASTLAVVAAVGVQTLARRPQLATVVVERALRGTDRLARRHGADRHIRAEAFVAQLRTIRPGARDWFVAVAFAALNWSADVACLVFACQAAGVTGLTPRTVLIAYAADATVGALQLVPGGIGVVDGALVLALVHGGIPADAAAAGVVVYRLISFVLATIAGWCAWYLIRERPSSMTTPSVSTGDPADSSL